MVNALPSQLPQLSLSTGMQWQWVDQALYCQNLVFDRYIFSSHFKKNYVAFLKKLGNNSLVLVYSEINVERLLWCFLV